MKAFNKVILEIIKEVIVLSININSYYKSYTFFYIVSRISNSDIILGI